MVICNSLLLLEGEVVISERVDLYHTSHCYGTNLHWLFQS